MSDWQPGDLALCVGLDPRSTFVCHWRPLPGSVCTVVEVVESLDEGDNAFCGLNFAEDQTPNPLAAFDAAFFRKITPGAKIEGIEEPRRLPVKERQDA